jgi:hypothetical protein
MLGMSSLPKVLPVWMSIFLNMFNLSIFPCFHLWCSFTFPIFSMHYPEGFWSICLGSEEFLSSGQLSSPVKKIHTIQLDWVTKENKSKVYSLKTETITYVPVSVFCKALKLIGCIWKNSNTDLKWYAVYGAQAWDFRLQGFLRRLSKPVWVGVFGTGINPIILK